MAFRNDLSIDWSVSPRIITVDSPSTNLDVKDLYDTLRTAEAQASNMDEPFITDAGGYEPLGGGVKVGITVTLRDALVAFEARSGPTYEQMRITGGNMVTYDPNLDQYLDSSVSPTAFTQIVQANSSSATLQELSSIQFASYNGGVTIDFDNLTGRATSGREFPAGTLEQPTDNLADLDFILTEVGLNRIYVIGNLHLDQGISWIRHEFIGDSGLKTLIEVDPAATVLNCEFYDCTITGTLDGNSQIERGVISDLDFVDGYVYQCALGPVAIQLGTSTIANFFSCYSTIPGTGTPIIDMNGTGQLALRDYNGGMLLKNYTGSSSHSIDLSSGQIKLEAATITSGIFVVRGVGKLVDSVTGEHIHSGTWNGGVTIINELLNSINTSEAVWDVATVDHAVVGSMGEKQGTAAAGSDVDAIWNEPTANHTTPGSTGQALADAGGAGNPWSSTLAGNNVSGTFGYLLQTTFVGNFASIINRLATATATTIRKITGGQQNQV